MQLPLEPGPMLQIFNAVWFDQRFADVARVRSRCRHHGLVKAMMSTNNEHLLGEFDMDNIVDDWLLPDIRARLAPGHIAVVTFWGDELQQLERDGRAAGRPGLAAEFTQILADICRRGLFTDIPVQDHAARTSPICEGSWDSQG